MPNLMEATQRIGEAKLPVLFLDTCILLDVIRSTVRRRPSDAERAVELKRRLTASPPRCVSVVSSLVTEEWGANREGVASENRQHLKKMTEHSTEFHDACVALDLQPGFHRANYEHPNLSEALTELSRTLLTLSVTLDPDEESERRAVKRLRRAQPPSMKGGQLQDCIILEDYLAVCRSLRAGGHPNRLVFSTSNTSDYCIAKKTLHAALADEFAPVGLFFATNLGEAIPELDGLGHPQ